MAFVAEDSDPFAPVTVTRSYQADDFGKLDYVGACQITADSLHCWDPDGKDAPDLTENIKAYYIVQSQTLQFKFGRKNRLLVFRRPGNQGGNVTLGGAPMHGTTYANQAGQLANNNNGRERYLEWYALDTDPSKTTTELTFSLNLNLGAGSLAMKEGADATVGAMKLHLDSIKPGPDKPESYGNLGHQKTWLIAISSTGFAGDHVPNFYVRPMGDNGLVIQRVDTKGNPTPVPENRNGYWQGNQTVSGFAYDTTLQLISGAGTAHQVYSTVVNPAKTASLTLSANGERKVTFTNLLLDPKSPNPTLNDGPVRSGPGKNIHPIPGVDMTVALSLGGRMRRALFEVTPVAEFARRDSPRRISEGPGHGMGWPQRQALERAAIEFCRTWVKQRCRSLCVDPSAKQGRPGKFTVSLPLEQRRFRRSMNKTYAVLGAGMQGTAAAFDLAKFAEPREILLTDASLEKASQSADRVNRLVGREICSPHEIDALNPKSLGTFLKRVDVLLSCVPFWMHPSIAKVAIATNTNMCDLGGNTDVTRETLAMDEDAKRAGVTLIPDTGLAPGLVNSIGLYLIEHLDEAESVKLFCGVLPQHPKPPFNYKLTFNVEGLVTEYQHQAVALRDGEIVLLETLDEIEELSVEQLGRMEAFTTSGGTSTAPYTLQGRVKNYQYKTIRWPGHCERMRIFKDFGFWGDQPVDVRGQSVKPRDVFCKVFGESLAKYQDLDQCVIRGIGIGTRGGEKIRMQVDIFDKQCDETGFTSMERTTGFSIAIHAAAIAAGKLPKGCLRYETALTGTDFCEQIQKRGVAIKVSEEKL